MSKTCNWQGLVDQLDLQPHPEGGFYREVFRSDKTLPFNGRARPVSTSIYYLLAAGNYSAWHQIDADETWYFLAGQALQLYVLSEDGQLNTHRLGNPLTQENVVFQLTAKAGHWF